MVKERVGPDHETVISFGTALMAILAFAGNSLLTRAALAEPVISPALFVAVRMASGAVALMILAALRGKNFVPSLSDVPGIASLGTYAIAFTFAYVSLGAATGALLLFATVQLTMGLIDIASGNKPSIREVSGLIVAMSGLVWLLAPHLTLASPFPSALMILAGVAWGIYSVLGRRASDPVGRTTCNFVGTLPAAAGLALVSSAYTSDWGLLLAITSGVLTSAGGYLVWYAVLPKLSVATAGAAQLLVPVFAASGAALFIGEALSGQLVMAGCIIIVGIGLTIYPART